MIVTGVDNCLRFCYAFNKVPGTNVKKLSKGYAPDVIADVLEEPLESIQEICDIALKYAPDYDVKKILDEYIKVKNAQPV